MPGKFVKATVINTKQSAPGNWSLYMVSNVLSGPHRLTLHSYYTHAVTQTCEPSLERISDLLFSRINAINSFFICMSEELNNLFNTCSNWVSI